MRIVPCMAASILAACAAFGQNAQNSQRFEAADVHPSPLTGVVAARGPFTFGARYDLHNATMVDLISKAYGVAADKVLEGPSWLEYDRFEVAALMPSKMPPSKTFAEDDKLMLQALLADRFQLVLHKEDRPVPAYVLSAPKGKQKLKESDGSGEPGCRMNIDQSRQGDGTVSNLALVFTCRSTWCRTANTSPSSPQPQAEEKGGSVHMTFLFNFFDELRRRAEK